MWSRLCHKYLQTYERTLKVSQVMKFSSSCTGNSTVGDVPKDPRCKGKVKPRKHLDDIYSYIHSKDSLKNNLSAIPSRFLMRRIKSPESIYLIDNEVADEIFNLIRADLLSTDSYVIEVNPGLGLITQKLLATKIQRLRLFEADQIFFANLKNTLSQSKQEAVDIFQANFNNFWSLSYQDSLDGSNRLESMMSGIPKKPWESEQPVFKIIGALPDHKIIKYFTSSTFFQSDLSQYGRPEMYVILPPPSYIRLTCSREAGYFLYRSVSVLFQLIFEAEILKKLPCKAFVPWRTKYVPQKRSKLTKVNTVDDEFLYLVKITGRRNLFSEIVPPHLLKPLWYFVQHHMTKRSSKVIQQMEHWAPGCGPRLISKGLTIFSEFGDLSPFQILDLFLYFSSWPEFTTSHFLHSMENKLMKIEEPGPNDDLEEEDNNDDVSNIICEKDDHSDFHEKTKQS